MDIDIGHLILLLIALISTGTTLYTSRMNGALQHQLSQQEEHRALKLAALDKRLEVHQNAWTMWNELLFNLSNPEDLYKASTKAARWFTLNNLYLESNAREAFYSAYMSASFLSDNPESTRVHERKTWLEWRREVWEAGEKIAKGVELPALEESPEDYAERMTRLASREPE